MADDQTVKTPEAAPPKLYERGTWLHERDGDLNPTWIFVSIYLTIGSVVCIGALLTGKATAIIGALSFLGVVITALLIAALPVAKSKVLARAHLGEIASGISGGSGLDRFGGPSSEHYEDGVDEK